MDGYLMNDAILVFTSVGSEQQAITIAYELVNLQLAACINIIPDIRSIYRYKGKVCDDSEFFLIIKTSSDLFDEVAAEISRLHTYEIPEIIAVKSENCKDNFLNWLNRNVRSRNLVNPVTENVAGTE